MTIENDDDLQALKKAGEAASKTLLKMKQSVEEGMTGLELDEIGRKSLESFGAQSAPKLSYNFPGYTCISINEIVAHGIPDATKIKKGDLINIDVSCEINGYFADTGASFHFEGSDFNIKKLLKSTKRALRNAIQACKSGQKLNVIGQNIEKEARKSKFTIIENLASHGVGSSLHEFPESIYSYYEKRDRRKMHKGMVFTIEPFLSTGAREVHEIGDGWSLSAGEGYKTAQFEHSLVITDSKPILLTQNEFF